MNIQRRLSAAILVAATLAAPLFAPQLRAQTSEPATDPTWWKHAVIYEIYPRSFQDTNGDGLGDLNGITQRLDYLKDLGVDAIWIAPMFPSPQKDFGYDISDYRAVDPQYGTMKDMDRLIAEAKKRNIKILLDFVLNHTSDKHPWFVESASSKTNPKRDWYIWRDPASCTSAQGAALNAGGNGVCAPTDWISIFGGSAWQFDQATKQFYYHAFLIQQPDLNWRNPQVEKAMFDNMRFWMDRGVYGFRLDAVPELFETPELKDEKLNGKTNEYGTQATDREFTNNLPEVHNTMRRMRKVADSYKDGRVIIGETYLPNIAEVDKWYGGAAKDELQLPMDMLVGFSSHTLNAERFRKNLTDIETGVHGSQPLLVFDNHDNNRSWDRYTDGKTPEEKQAVAKLLAAVLFTTRSTALMYYGQELGMNTELPKRIEDVRDPNGIAGWARGEKGRDGERTPMQWDNSAQAGFSKNATTWLPVAPNYVTVNVATEKQDPESLFNWYKHLIAMRRTNAALREGTMTMIDINNPNVLSYVRTAPSGASSNGDADRVIVSVNMTATEQKVMLTIPGSAPGKITTLAASTAALRTNPSSLELTLPPFASWVGEVR